MTATAYTALARIAGGSRLSLSVHIKEKTPYIGVFEKLLFLEGSTMKLTIKIFTSFIDFFSEIYIVFMRHLETEFGFPDFVF